MSSAPCKCPACGSQQACWCSRATIRAARKAAAAADSAGQPGISQQEFARAILGDLGMKVRR